MSDLKYPIGKLELPTSGTPDERREWIQHIADLPQQVRKAVAGLDESQLETPYRADGWTVRQVVHHLADSHLNSYLRCKLTLTEDTPTIKPFDEAAWAEIDEGREGEIEPSLRLLDSLHLRWTRLLGDLNDQDFEKQFHHPEMGTLRLDQNCAIYAWHGKHHVAHITALREREGW